MLRREHEDSTKGVPAPTRGFTEEVTGPHSASENEELNLLLTALHDVTQISPLRLIYSYNTSGCRRQFHNYCGTQLYCSPLASNFQQYTVLSNASNTSSIRDQPLNTLE
jgi:hypothetical protein